MNPNTFFRGKINIYLSKAPEARDLIQFTKKKRIERNKPECNSREYEMLLVTRTRRSPWLTEF